MLRLRLRPAPGYRWYITQKVCFMERNLLLCVSAAAFVSLHCLAIASQSDIQHSEVISVGRTFVARDAPWHFIARHRARDTPQRSCYTTSGQTAAAIFLWKENSCKITWHTSSQLNGTTSSDNIVKRENSEKPNIIKQSKVSNPLPHFRSFF